MRVQIDAPQVIRSFLRAQVENVRIVSQLPDGWSRDDPPVVVVMSGNNDTTTRSWTAEAVRVTVYASHSPYARDLITQIDGLLIDRRWVDGVVVYPGVFVAPIYDTKLGCFVAAVTVSVASERKEV